MNYRRGRGRSGLSRGRGGRGRSGQGRFVARGGGHDVHSIAGRGGNNKTNKWVRKPNSINGDEDQSKGESSVDGTFAQTGLSQGGKTGDTKAAHPHPDKYKWKRQPPELSTNSSDNTTILEKSNDEWKSDSTETNETTVATHTEIEKGKHTTLKDGGEKNSASQAKSSNNDTQFTNSKNKSNSWKRPSSELPVQPNVDNKMKKCAESNNASTTSMARGKAIFLKGDNSWKRQSTSEMEASYRKSTRGQNLISKHDRKRKHTTTGPRRICLLSSTMSNEEKSQEQLGEKQTNNATVGKSENGNTDVITGEISASTDDTQQSPGLQKTLTDFRYQDTGSGGRGKGRGRGRGGRSAVCGNIGLARVKTADPSSTPICPTFRRGVPCNNPKCKLRHDVSTEASRPICVFFQRNGMCSKGDECSFRHVKISWDAEICPMFQKVGYCEDANCLLRHVDAKKPRIEASSSTKRQLGQP